jgi:hypothetical protein
VVGWGGRARWSGVEYNESNWTLKKQQARKTPFKNKNKNHTKGIRYKNTHVTKLIKLLLTTVTCM